MWNKYNFLKAYYPEQTSMHTEALITYVRYKVKEEMAVANDRSTDAKTWGELAMKQAERAKINPNQFSKADLQGGLSTIGEIAQAVEQEQDIIKILPKFRFRPNDAVDFCIWNYINYARELEGKPTVEYSDVYKFYVQNKTDMERRWTVENCSVNDWSYDLGSCKYDLYSEPILSGCYAILDLSVDKDFKKENSIKSVKKIEFSIEFEGGFNDDWEKIDGLKSDNVVLKV